MKIYISIINTLLITAGIFLGVQVLYAYVDGRLQIPPKYPIQSRAQVSSDNQGAWKDLTYTDAVQRNLFKTGKASIPAEPQKITETKDLKRTSLNLKLWGTVTGGEGVSYAVIEDAAQRRQKLYQVGDTVQSASIRSILKEKVVLRHDDRDEILEMEKKRSGSTSASRTARSSLSRTNPIVVEATPGNRIIHLNKSVVDNAVGNLNTLIRQVRIRPHLENGKPSGMRVTSIRPNSIFQKMGLRNGDIIKGVDGRDIQTVDDALKLYENLKDSTGVSVQIQRRGNLQNIEYRVRD